MDVVQELLDGKVGTCPFLLQSLWLLYGWFDRDGIQQAILVRECFVLVPMCHRHQSILSNEHDIAFPFFSQTNTS